MKSNANNILVFIVKNGLLRDIFSKPKHLVVLFRSIHQLNKELFEMTHHHAKFKTYDDEENQKLPNQQLPNQQLSNQSSLKMTINNFQKIFAHIHTLEIFIRTEMIQRMTAFNTKAFEQLHTLTINGSVDMFDVKTIPSNVKTLILRNLEDSPPLPKNFMSLLPKTLQTLMIYFEFYGYLKDFPESLKNLTINYVNYDLNKVEDLNSSLVKLSLGDNWFNGVLVSIPPNLTHFRLGSRFNGNIEILQTTGITHLAFGDVFNQPVNNLSSQLKWVEFGVRFNQPVNKLPSTLEHVCFLWDFDQSINELPSSIKYLRIDSEKFQQMGVKWPNLVVLDINTPSYALPMTTLPKTLEVLKVEKSVYGEEEKEYDFTNLPRLTKLSINGDFNISLHDVLPNTLTHLILGNRYNKPLSYLPISLRYLRIGAAFWWSNIGHRSVCHLKLVTHQESIIGKTHSGEASNIFGKDITLKISAKIHDVTKSYRSQPFTCKEFISC